MFSFSRICPCSWKMLMSVFLLSLLLVLPGESLHLSGSWETDNFFLFLSKFGFQKTEANREKNATSGYIFGNITSAKDVSWMVATPPSKRLVKREKEGDGVISSDIIKSSSNSPKNGLNAISTVKMLNASSSTSSSSTTTAKTIPASTSAKTTTTSSPGIKVFPATMVVLDRGYFVDFYRNRHIADKDEACRQMFKQISHVSYDPLCNTEGLEHFIKRIPCPMGQVCPDDASNTSYVVKDHQFTYAISDPNQPKFWYASLVACYRDPITCQWKHSGNSISVDYDMWLVNGNPYTKNQNPLEYQFSFDRQDTVEIYLVFFICYLVLFPLQIHAVIRQRHVVPKLFTGSVSLELAAVLANVIHVLKFSINGVGHPSLAVFGDVMDIAARALFMLILLVLAKGWAVTRTELTGKPFIFTIWTVYGVVHILLYVWKETEVDVIEDIDEYQTWPGWLILVLRNIIMMWFLYELKDTMDSEHQPHKLNFFLHFGAASLVWFVYLPIFALIALQVTPLWRSKLLLGITYSADCFAFAVMTHLLWPTRSQQYFLLSAKETSLINDELEEFNEAPHVINSYARRSNNFFRESDSWNANQHFNGVGNGSVINDDYKDNTPLIKT